ncbi:MAG: hypothetical protein IPP88_24955 [Betaproteobacteria bacterium]|nr:hypothetical protein [Betaproteobacteria bacterium]
MPKAKFDWYYQHNSEGTPLVVFLRLEGADNPVGVAAVGPRRMRFGEVTFTAGALVDFVLQLEHRTFFFPAIFLQRKFVAARLVNTPFCLASRTRSHWQSYVESTIGAWDTWYGVPVYFGPQCT